MTTILSWNIQNGLGIDGELSLERIADEIRRICAPDIICLQEVSIGTLLPDGSYENQVATLSELFSEFTPHFGVAVDRLDVTRGQRAQFGNLVLSRFPVLSVFHHLLPQPPDGRIKQMPRQLLELTVEAPSGALRVMTTHLEFHSPVQRLAQANRIVSFHNEVSARATTPGAPDSDGPYAEIERPVSCVLCGDFNFLETSPEYKVVITSALESSRLHDAWKLANIAKPHAATCGLHKNPQWPEGPHCRDFIFVSNDIMQDVEQVFVDVETTASDHQPIVLQLE